jgi:hypothetical protein
MSIARKLKTGLVTLAAVLVAIQFVPYGRQHTNPSDGVLASFDSPSTRDLAARACFDCHSNRTQWPWYSSIAPISWRVQRHVDEGREALNFSAFDPTREEVAEAAGEAGETVAEREMPPNDYLLMHPEARLTPVERQALTRGLEATFAEFVSIHEAERGEKDGH